MSKNILEAIQGISGETESKNLVEAIDAAASNLPSKSDISSVYQFKGSVATEAALPATGQANGDVYNIEADSSYGPAGMNVAWTGTGWDALGSFKDVLPSVTASDEGKVLQVDSNGAWAAGEGGSSGIFVVEARLLNDATLGDYITNFSKSMREILEAINAGQFPILYAKAMNSGQVYGFPMSHYEKMEGAEGIWRMYFGGCFFHDPSTQDPSSGLVVKTVTLVSVMPVDANVYIKTVTLNASS